MKCWVKVRGVLPAALYVAVVFWLGSIDSSPSSTLASHDKLSHALVFAIMQVLNFHAGKAFARWTLGPDTEISRLKRALYGSAAVSASLGAALELWQSLLPQRSAEWGDWAADLAGVVVMAALQRRCVLAPHSKAEA